jgi:hypothetical protein
MLRGSIALLVSATAVLHAQTTQGLITGKVVDSQTGNPLPGTRIVAFNLATNLSQAAVAEDSGFYVLPLLSPGTYQVRAEAKGYQSLQVEQLELEVASSLTLPFRLRPLSDVFEQNQYRSVFFANNSVVPFYGPDVDTSRTGSFEPPLSTRGMLETSVSYVIDPQQIANLPLVGRDVYALLVTLPAVTTDISTARGLGFSVTGQRPSASNFLLDGLENNNYLITGPAVTVPPEAVQEYRISTNNYSAEYGRTAGFLANVVTRTGGTQWHGLTYLNFANEALDANQFQRNLNGLLRSPDKQWEPGFSGGGPIRAPNLFISGTIECQRFRGGGDPEDIALPTTNFIPKAGSLAETLLRGFNAPTGPGLTKTLSLTPPSSINQWFVVPRADYVIHEGSQRFLARAAIIRNTRPDFIWTPYPAFSSPLTQNTTSLMGSWLGSRGHLTNEMRVGWTLTDLRFDRAQPKIPQLSSDDGILLPGSPAFYGFHNRERNVEFVESLLWVRGRHALKFGGGGLFRGIQGYLTAGQAGSYTFASLSDFGDGRPNSVQVALSRLDFEKGNYHMPVYDRTYSQRQAFFFVQDSLRVSGRLVLNFGLRYEDFGVPVNVGAVKDPTLDLNGATPSPQAIRNAQVVSGPASDQPLYSSRGNWAVRVGGAWSLRENARTLLRISYGTFYDRPFDNLWENLRNNGVVFSGVGEGVPLVVPIAGIYPSLKGLVADTLFTKFYLLSPQLNAPYIQSYFAALSHELSRSLMVEATAFNTAGSNLITTDLINRTGGPVNPNLPEILYRANQGISNYHGLGVLARYRTSRAQFQVAYTWSHSIDNQSEPLFGDFYNLLPTRAGANTGGTPQPTFFFEQYNSLGDRGNSDYDQRHNLVAFGIWQLPQPPARSRAAAWLRDWRAAFLAAARSGFPYTATSESLTRRLSLVNPALLSAPRAAVTGGVQLFDPHAFYPAPGTAQGNTYRNQFSGPGLYSIDVSLNRSWPVHGIGEGARVSLRADAFNVLNHANLGNPGSALGGPGFGLALYGRRENQPNFPALTPFNESARQFQILLRFEF